MTATVEIEPANLLAIAYEFHQRSMRPGAGPLRVTSRRVHRRLTASTRIVAVMNEQLSFETLRSRADENASSARTRRRRSAAALAAVAVFGASITACSDSGADAGAAPTDVTVVAGDAEGGGNTESDPVDAGADATPPFSQEGGPVMGGGPGGLAGIGGEVTAIDGSTITVENQGRDGTTTTLTVETDDDTSVTTSLAGTVDDLAVGDTIVAFGETTDEQFVASSVDEGAGGMRGPVFQAGGPSGAPGGDVATSGTGRPPVFTEGQTPPDGSMPAGGPAGGPPSGQTVQMDGRLVAGTIVEIDDSTITVESQDGVQTVVALDDATTITVSEDLALSDIAIGSTIRVSGDDTDGTVDETTVHASSITVTTD